MVRDVVDFDFVLLFVVWSLDLPHQVRAVQCWVLNIGYLLCALLSDNSLEEVSELSLDLHLIHLLLRVLRPPLLVVEVFLRPLFLLFCYFICPCSRVAVRTFGCCGSWESSLTQGWLTRAMHRFSMTLTSKLFLSTISSLDLPSLGDNIISGRPHEVMQAPSLLLIGFNSPHHFISYIIVLVLDHDGPVLIGVKALLGLLFVPFQLLLFLLSKKFTLLKLKLVR